MSDASRNGPHSRAPLYTFLALVALGAAIGYAVAFFTGEENLRSGLLLVQFAPLVAAFATKLTFQHNLRGLGWGWGKTRYILAAYGLAFLLPAISFGLVWFLGFGGFFDAAFVEGARRDIAGQFGIELNSTNAVVLVLIAVNATVGLLIAFPAIGEEIGWRGFLVPELARHTDFTRTALISGAIWVVYHYPLLLVLVGPRLGVSPLPLMLFALVGGIGLSTIMAWFRLRSGSVWTAVIFHMALNAHNQGSFQNLTFETSRLTHYISGEYGLMAALVSAIAGYLFWRRRGVLSSAGDTRPS